MVNRGVENKILKNVFKEPLDLLDLFLFLGNKVIEQTVLRLGYIKLNLRRNYFFSLD